MEIKLNLTLEEHKEVVAYCNLNDLLISTVVKDSFKTGFNIERYGLLNSNKEKVIEKEIIKEKIIEVPVEVIKEVVKIEYIEIEKPVEIIKEIPVDRVVERTVEVIKEIPIEKIVTKIENNCDENEINQMANKIKELENRPPKVVEIVKEIPVEVIKEVVVEKNSAGNLQPKLEALQNTLQKLKQDNIEKDRKIQELEKNILDLQKFQEDKKVMYLRGSNLNDNFFKVKK